MCVMILGVGCDWIVGCVCVLLFGGVATTVQCASGSFGCFWVVGGVGCWESEGYWEYEDY